MQVKQRSCQHVVIVLNQLTRVTPPAVPSAPGKSADSSSAVVVSAPGSSWQPPILHLPERTMINEALRRWKDLDVELTEATNEVRGCLCVIC